MSVLFLTVPTVVLLRRSRGGSGGQVRFAGWPLPKQPAGVLRAYAYSVQLLSLRGASAGAQTTSSQFRISAVLEVKERMDPRVFGSVVGEIGIGIVVIVIGS